MPPCENVSLPPSLPSEIWQSIASNLTVSDRLNSRLLSTLFQGLYIQEIQSSKDSALKTALKRKDCAKIKKCLTAGANMNQQIDVDPQYDDGAGVFIRQVSLDEYARQHNIPF